VHFNEFVGKVKAAKGAARGEHLVYFFIPFMGRDGIGIPVDMHFKGPISLDTRFGRLHQTVDDGLEDRLSSIRLKDRVVEEYFIRVWNIINGMTNKFVDP
jgi:hypothetical protein